MSFAGEQRLLKVGDVSVKLDVWWKLGKGLFLRRLSFIFKFKASPGVEGSFQASCDSTLSSKSLWLFISQL
jgi:hypothetical protein